MRFPRLVVAALTLAFLPAARADELRAGFAVRELTPDYAVPLGGFSARLGKLSTGVHDPVCARAMVLDNGETRLAIVALDMIGCDRRCREAMARYLAKNVHIAPEHLLVCATHTHSAPGAMAREVQWWIAMGPYDDKLFRKVARLTAEAVQAACAALQPARLGVSLTKLEGFNRNRRVDGGPCDTDFTLVRVDQADGTPIGVLINYAAHPTILGADNMKVSADYPGALCRELERRHGAAFHALFTNGDEGDMGPGGPGAPSDFERVEAMGKALADEVDQRLPAVTTNSRALLRGAIMTMDLPPAKIPVVFPDQVMIQYLQIQDGIFLAVPGEMCVDVGKDVKAAVQGLGQASTTIVGLANDHLGYFTSPEGLAHGGYEADMNFYGKDIGATFEKAFRKLVKFEDPWGM